MKHDVRGKESCLRNKWSACEMRIFNKLIKISFVRINTWSRRKREIPVVLEDAKRKPVVIGVVEIWLRYRLYLM